MISFVEALFLVISFFIVFCIIMTLLVPKTMQAAYWLILMLTGVAVLFLLANSEIIFAFQISIYAGGISVLLLFAALLTQHEEYEFPRSILGFIKVTASQLAIFLIIGINLLILILTSVMSSDFRKGTSSQLGDTTLTVEESFFMTENFSVTLWRDFGMVIPFLAFLLLTALLGSVKLVIREWEIEDLSDVMKNRYNPTQEVQQ
ncbi:MAG: NADH-quinone oxidoreductase subunit J [Candidatus Heimdallarchaeota archaeon]|nr:NADH-quinone oxidoreductase subunit J [Candidatus Heimdallarchaeota archaeon]MDH5645465.1 NADH-quinone oxidoreductase subunit J [Candidatus Heimdallarchaeota archaeon]